MKDRIILLIKAKNLTAAQFADEIGVQKSSISHIISGRNNASLDFIQKVLLCYPDVNMEWLMFGKGPLFKGTENYSKTSNDEFSTLVSSQNIPPVDLFSELNPDQRTDFRNLSDFSTESESSENKKNVLIPSKEKTDQPSNYKIRKPQDVTSASGHENTTTKSILKIVEFYSDNTYREYFPE
jgi:transcriptional regulator with XRE-family HTH domain